MSETKAQAARRHITALNGTSYRAESGYLHGRNRDFTLNTVEWHFRAALRAVVAIEDTEGIDAAAKLSDRLTAARQRAVAANLLTPGQVASVEREVCA